MSYIRPRSRESAPMLDAFIIEKIRKEREHRDSAVPLRIHVPRPQDDPKWRHEQRQKHDDREGGVVIIDYSI